MKVKDIQNIILSYDMDYDTIIKYSKEDLTTTLEGLSSSLETVIDNNNNYLINDILEYYIDIFDTIENIDDLDIYVNKIKKIISNLYKTKDITNDNISECINFLQNIISSIKKKNKESSSLKRFNYLKKIIYETKDIEIIKRIVIDSKDILKIKNNENLNILEYLFKDYGNSTDKDYLYQVINVFISNDSIRNNLIENEDKYLPLIEEYDEFKAIVYLINEKDNKIDINFLEQRYNLKLEFPSIITSELFTYDINYSGYIDMTDKNFLTIDDSEAKCLDDAIAIEENDDGSYNLYIAISYVPGIIPYDSVINRTSIELGETKYLCDNVYSLYGDYISNYLGSLLPLKKRYAEVGIWKLDSNMQIDYDSFKLVRAIIESKHKLSYDISDTLINDDYSNIGKCLYLLGTFALKQRKNNTTKEKYRAKENEINPNKLHESLLVDRFVSANIVQECALLFGKSKAMLYNKLNLPFIYRACDANNNFNINRLVENNIDVSSLSGSAQAYYTSTPKPHFGLGYNLYSHTTSPLRRSVDGELQYIGNDLLYERQKNDRRLYYWEDRVNNLSQYYNDLSNKISNFSSHYNYLSKRNLIKK